MSWLFPKKKEYKDYYNEAFLLAVFAPKENLEKLTLEYNSKKRSSYNNSILKAKLAGIMAGLEKRNRSRLATLQNSISIDNQRDGRENKRMSNTKMF